MDFREDAWSSYCINCRKMTSFRVVDRGGVFYPQERFLGVFWLNIFYKDFNERGGFETYREAQRALSEHILRVDKSYQKGSNGND